MDRNRQKITETDKNRQKPAETGRIGEGGGTKKYLKKLYLIA